MKDIGMAAIRLRNDLIFTEFFGGEISRAEKVIDELVEKWQSPCRFYHSAENHLLPMLTKIDWMTLNYEHQQILEIAAWFHDAVYNPKADDNESQSAKFFYDSVPNFNKNALAVLNIINMTKDFKSSADTALGLKFAKLDLEYLRCNSIDRIVRNELLMIKEFQFADYSAFKQRRIEVLQNIKNMHLVDCTKVATIDNICSYLEHHRPRIGIYAGTFNPFHVGHLSVLKEAEKLFDKVIVAVGINPQKHQVDDIGASIKAENLKKSLPYHQVEFFGRFLHEYVEEKSKDADITVIRGFRSGHDIEEELKTLAFIRDMSDNVNMIFIAPQKKYDHVSSSAIKLLKNFDQKEYDRYIPDIYYPGS